MFTEKQTNQMVLMYETSKLGLDKIAFEFGCARGTVRKELTKMGIIIRKPWTIKRPTDKFDLKDKKRFWDKVIKTNLDSCWEWTATIDSCGYGRFGFRYKLLTSHRVAWELENGPIPKDLHVLHKCDNPSCCNPAHLFLGTHQDNMKDRDKKGRAKGGSLKGENNPSCRFTEQQINEIRSMWENGIKQKIIAKKFKTSQPVISAIVNYKYWKHV